MIQVRYDMFETNSSSCHVFMFPKGMGVKVPSTVELNDDYDTVDNMPNLFFNDINWGEEYTTPFIRMLYRCGVKTIKYTGKDKFVTDAIKKYKDEDNSDAQLEYPRLDIKYFKMVVFGTDVKLTTMEDWMVSDEEVAKQGDFENYCAVRLS